MGHQDRETASSAARAIEAGAPVHVRTRFDGGWTSGFAVAEVVADGSGHESYRLRRSIDGCVLPALFAPEDVMPAAPTATTRSARRA